MRTAIAVLKGGTPMPEEILKNIYRLPIPLAGNPLKELNAYLIKGRDRNLLIDTGFRCESCRTALFQQLAELGLQPGDVDVLLTHLHSDHSGLCAEAAGEHGTIYISGQDDFMLQSHLVWEQHWRALCNSMDRQGFSLRAAENLWGTDASDPMDPPHDTPHICLNDGDVLEAGGYRLQAVLTPGHTPGHMCFWMENEGTMFLGDHVLFDISPNITAWNGFPDALGVYLQSLQKIQEYPVELPLPAHRGRGVLSERVDALIRHHDRRLEETLRILHEQPGLNAYELAGKMTWRIRARSWEEFPLTQKWFAVGETVAHLEHLVALGQLSSIEKNGVAYYFTV